MTDTTTSGPIGGETMSKPAHSDWAFGLFLAVVGATGLTASLALSIEKVAKLTDPDKVLGCDVSALVQCSTNLESSQGVAFGFPNPFIGLIGFALVLGIGVAVWAVPSFARWFWVVFNIGAASALAFVLWLIWQSIYALGTLCPWCLVVWAATIPLFLIVTTRNLTAGVFGSRMVRVGAALRPWVLFAIIFSYIAVGLLAQLRLNVLGSIL